MRLVARILVLLAISLILSHEASAQSRTWRKYHQSIQMDGLLGEYTAIITSDSLSPQTARYLYRDTVGALLVIRNETALVLDGDVITGVGSFQTSIQCVGTGEQIAFSHDGEGSVSVMIGSAPFNYGDSPTNRPLPAGVRQQARTLFGANLSEPCRAAIERCAGVTARFSSTLTDVGWELVDLFFPNVILGPVTDHSSEESDSVIPFDPQTTPPGPFELLFGAAYFE